MARGGVRQFIRETTACEPGGCGAQPGQPCTAYVLKRGKTTGKSIADVHAARWRAFRVGLNRQQPEREEQAVERDGGIYKAGRTEPGDLVTVSVLRDRIDSAMEELAGLGVYGHLRLTGGPYPEDTLPEDKAVVAGHVHDWRVLGMQEAPAAPAEFVPLGKPLSRTVVLTRCASCGQPEAQLHRTWTQADFGN